jgi:hypothetical protein
MLIRFIVQVPYERTSGLFVLPQGGWVHGRSLTFKKQLAIFLYSIRGELFPGVFLG